MADSAWSGDTPTNKLLIFLGRVAVLIPVAHILACSINLIGYTLAFGGNITSLLSVADLFSITFSGMGTAYVIGLFIPAAFIWWLHSMPDPPPVVVQNQEEGEALKVKWKRNAIIRDRVTSWVGILMIGFAAFRSFYDQPNSPALFFQGVFLTYIKEFWNGFERRGLTNIQTSTIWILLMFVTVAFGSGSFDAQVDRRAPFKEVRVGRYGCGDYVVLRHVGDDFIAVRRDDRRIIINQDCKILFEFPVLAPFTHKGEFPTLHWPKWAKW